MFSIEPCISDDREWPRKVSMRKDLRSISIM